MKHLERKDSTNGYSAESVSPETDSDRKQSRSSVSVDSGPRDSQPNELDHEISFACLIAPAMRSGSLRTKRKRGGGTGKGLVFCAFKKWED